MKPHFLVVLALLVAGVPAARAQLVGDMAEAAVALAAPRVEQAGKRAAYTFESAGVAEAFNGVVVQGFADGEGFEGWIRFEETDGWGAWLPLYVVRSATDAAFLAAYRSDTFRQGGRFELRFSTETGGRLHLVGAGVFDNRRDADRLAGAAPGAGAKASDHLFPPVMYARPVWGAAPFIGNPIPLARPSHDYITFHHAAGFGATTLDEGLQQVKNIQTFHQNGRGWSDIGYHFVMDQSGRLYQGRPFLTEPVALKEVPRLVQGAHVGNNNTGNIGVCVLGCYHPPEGANCRDAITPAALDSLVTMFAFLSDAYGVPTNQIKGHRDFSSTACPGDNNYPLLPQIRQRVQDLLRTGNQPLGAATLDAASDDAGVVRLAWTFLEDNGITAYRIERVYDDEAAVVFEGEGALPDAFTDAGLTRPGTVAYRLTARNAAGREQILAAAQVAIAAPGDYVLAHNFPNPFREATTIRYFLEQDGLVTLAVYDVTGRRVALLADAFQDGGRWYARSFDGRGLPGGTYFYRLRVDGFAGLVYDKTRAVTLVR